jgi:hypothetical protein
MRSLRLEADLDERVRHAASLEGTSVSEFLRRAATERAERLLAISNSDRLGDVIGSVRGGGGQADDTGAAFSDLLAERHRAR